MAGAGPLRAEPEGSGLGALGGDDAGQDDCCSEGRRGRERLSEEQDGPDEGEQGLSELELVDLLQSTAFFAWANRLMLTLGEPYTETV